jgi:penicillin amidase
VRPRALLPIALAAAVLGTIGCRPRLPSLEATAASSDTGQVRLPGLVGPATVVLDRFGIPHIRAANLHDLYFAWGYVTARDRLWQLEYSRRAARGTLSELFGNRALRDDGGAQLLELGERAAAIWRRQRADSAVRIPLEAYAAGVNAFADRCRRGERPWPVELQELRHAPGPWLPEDSILLLFAQALVLDFSLPELDEAKSLARIGRQAFLRRQRFEDRWIYATIPDTAATRLYGPPAGGPTDRVADVRPRGLAAPAATGGLDAAADRAGVALGRWADPATRDPAERASDVFAVGGRRSASGRPLLANDPHLPLAAPSPLHVVHLSVPGVLEAAGAAVPGLPAIVSGRNRTCAWGIAALSADVTDLYADTLSADGRHVRSGAGWSRMRVEPYRLAYRLPGGLTVPVPGLKRRYTPHGPVIDLDRRAHLALSVRWAVRDSTVTLARMLGIERSASAPEVAGRFRSLALPCLNVVAADTAGRVVYQTTGDVPDRGFVPDPGPLPDDGRHEWRGLVPPAAMPAWQAPPGGYVVNANNRPVGLACPQPWPRFDWAQDRALRIAGRLAGDPLLTLDDMRSVQNDVYSRGGERVVPLLLRRADPLASGLPSRDRAALDSLRSWDRMARRDRVGATIFRAWWGAYLRRAGMEDVPGLAIATLAGEAAPDTAGARGTSRDRVATTVVAALDTALARLTTRLGPDPSRWRYGRAHQARFRHALAWRDARLDAGPIAADGDNSTPCVGRSRLPWSTTYDHAPAFRHLVDLAQPESSLAVIPPGNSGDPRSPHDLDLLARWANHGYVPLYLAWDRVLAVRESEVRLLPAGR